MSTKTDKMRAIRDELMTFTASPLYVYRTENKYFPVIGEGSHDANVMFIGEAPGKTEALQGRPFCGRSGKMLDSLLESIELDRDQVYITNVVKDRPQDNRDPRPEEIALYSPFLVRQIDIIEPLIIATLGRFAMDFMLENYEHESPPQKISQAHGTTIAMKTVNGTEFTLVPLYHPAVALYNGSQKATLLEDFAVIKSLL